MPRFQRFSVVVEQPTSMSQDFKALPLNGMAIDRGPEHAYEALNEEAFRYFLTIERKRAERSGRSMLLLLVEFKSEREGDSRMDRLVSTKLFTGLAACVREIDFIGWYRTDRVAGAVLSQGSDTPAQDVAQQIGERVAQLLSERLPSHVRRRLQVRILQLHSKVKN
jgi:hypothetical protein